MDVNLNLLELGDVCDITAKPPDPPILPVLPLRGPLLRHRDVQNGDPSGPLHRVHLGDQPAQPGPGPAPARDQHHLVLESDRPRPPVGQPMVPDGQAVAQRDRPGPAKGVDDRRRRGRAVGRQQAQRHQKADERVEDGAVEDMADEVQGEVVGPRSGQGGGSELTSRDDGLHHYLIRPLLILGRGEFLERGWGRQ